MHLHPTHTDLNPEPWTPFWQAQLLGTTDRANCSVSPQVDDIVRACSFHVNSAEGCSSLPDLWLEALGFFGEKEPGDPEVRFSCSALGFRVLRLKGGGFGNSEALNPEPETPTGEKSETPSPAFGVQGVGMLDTDSPKP